MINTKLKFAASFFEEEEKCGFYITRKRKEVWAIELDLLHEFDQVCKKHGLNYFLDSGTLLGAIRHGGFIPWDDDIDVIMLRADYNKLLEIAPNEFRHPYFFQHAYTDMYYHRGHAQLRNSKTCGALRDEFLNVRFNQGIFIDIFVWDVVSDDERKVQQQVRELDHYWQMMERMDADVTPKPLILRRSDNMTLRYENRIHLYSLFDACAARFEGEQSQLVTQLAFHRKVKDNCRIQREWIAETKTAEFEGMTFPIPGNADALLRRYYGDDYMTPLNKAPIHSPVIFDTNRSYLDILAGTYL